MSMSGGEDDGEPMIDLNMTPLIDVLLVLLIMFIITIPIQTHAVKVDLPQPNNTPQNTIEPDKNKVIIQPTGQITWNGAAINKVTLRQYLDQTTRMAPEPELHFQPAPQARYARVDEVLAVIKRSNISRLGFVGNEQYRNDF